MSKNRSQKELKRKQKKLKVARKNQSKEKAILDSATPEEIASAKKIIAGAISSGITLTLPKAIFHLRQQRKENNLLMASQGFVRAETKDGVAQFTRNKQN